MSSQKLTEHFTVEEMKCECCGKADMNIGFMELLEKFRVAWGKPLNITSGFRCQKYNEKVKGVPNSQHLQGRAADIATAPLERYDFVKLAFQIGFTGIGIGKNFIHLDSREGGCNLWKYL